MCKQTRSHTGTHGDGITGTHTLTICRVFIDMHEDAQANLFAHPRGAHTHGDGYAHKLTCTHMVVNKCGRVTCARAHTHAELLACTGTFIRTHPARLTPTHVFPQAGAWPGVPGSPVCPPLSQHCCGQAKREFPAAKLQLTDLEAAAPALAGPS